MVTYYTIQSIHIIRLKMNTQCEVENTEENIIVHHNFYLYSVSADVCVKMVDG